MENQLTNRRITSLDTMRGLAILGILIANSIHFQFGLLPTSTVHNLYPLGILDRIAEAFITLFATASFYPLFSFLFGYGIILIQRKCEQSDLRFTFVYWRRMAILLILGLIHYFLIWDGDILLTYALAGFIFYFFLKMKDKSLLIFAFIFFMLMASALFITEDEEASLMIDEQLAHYSTEEMNAFTTGNYKDVVLFRLQADPFNMGGAGVILLQLSAILSVLSMFLLGAYVARKRWLENVLEHKSFIKTICFITLFIGLISKLPFVFHQSDQNEIIHTMIGGPFLAIFYATTIALLTNKDKENKWLHSLTFVGRLSLSNYILQSIVFTTLFYHYGLGLFNQIGVFSGLLIGFVFFILQIFISKWWLNRFHTGPLEWLWRIGTYLQIPKFRR